MSRTFREVPSWAKNDEEYSVKCARDHKPFGSKCEANSKHPKGYNTVLDDHGHYGAGGSKALKRDASRARRNFNKRVLQNEMSQF